jgi:hypothetical protein
MPQPRSHERRRVRAWPFLVALAAIGAGVAGFALGTSGGSDPESAPDARGAGQQSDAPSPATAEFDTRLRRIASTLDGRRARGRTRLRSARTPRGQAESAAALARAHEAAARSLGATSPPGARARASAAIGSSLRATGRAYRDLSRAARRGSGRRYAGAVRTVERREGALRRLLGGPVPRG